MHNRNYPIVLGHDYNNGVLILRHGDGFRFLIFRLKGEHPSGSEFDLGDIESIRQEIWFADRKTLEITISVMKAALKWGGTASGMRDTEIDFY